MFNGRGFEAIKAFHFLTKIGFSLIFCNPIHALHLPMVQISDGKMRYFQRCQVMSIDGRSAPSWKMKSRPLGLAGITCISRKENSAQIFSRKKGKKDFSRNLRRKCPMQFLIYLPASSEYYMLNGSCLYIAQRSRTAKKSEKEFKGR